MIESTEQEKKPNSRGLWKLFLVIAICASPLVLSYLAYYVIKPSGRTNYGTLLDPRQHPMPILNTSLQGGASTELSAFKGKWIMLQVSQASCAKPCQDGLFAMRQLRLMQGKEMDRIERVWIVTDAAPMETMLIREYDGMEILRFDEKSDPANNNRMLSNWLQAEPGSTIEDRLYLIDPLGNLMMSYPVGADPMKINKDLVKLLKASSIG